MNSIGEECIELKVAYDSCHNAWFKDKFLKGIGGDSCARLFKAYQKCVKVGYVGYSRSMATFICMCIYICMHYGIYTDLRYSSIKHIIK